LPLTNLASAPNGAAPPFLLLCSFRPRAGLVTSRQTFVRRRQIRNNDKLVLDQQRWCQGTPGAPPRGSPVAYNDKALAHSNMYKTQGVAI
jgi:hypothetical protein